MIEDNIEQRSLGWYRSRMGNFTGSRISELMKIGQKKEETFSKTAKSYIYQIAAERMFNEEFLNDDDVFQDYIEQTSYQTKAMQWGELQEDAARRLYKDIYHPNDILSEVSLCAHDKISHFAASPDGVIYYDRPKGKIKVLEIKCPNINAFMQYKTEIHDGESLKQVKPEYYWQIMAEISCTSADCATFVTYNPWISEPLYVADINRNEEDIAMLETRVMLANDLVDKIINNKNNE